MPGGGLMKIEKIMREKDIYSLTRGFEMVNHCLTHPISVADTSLLRDEAKEFMKEVERYMREEIS